jgi:SM-20-related protein
MPIPEELARAGHCIRENFAGLDEVAALLADFERERAAGRFTPAGVGRGDARVARPDIRRDEIRWLDPTRPAPAQRPVLTRLAGLQRELNERLFLGLWDFEAHYAHYAPGGFYLPHVDAFRDDDRRTVSFILYLNREWKPEDGGELRLHLAGGPLDVAPRAGTLACFLSRDIRHEVRPSRAARRSLTGWFRRRPPA